MSTIILSKAMSSEEKLSKAQYTAKTHTTGGREGGRSASRKKRNDRCFCIRFETAPDRF